MKVFTFIALVIISVHLVAQPKSPYISKVFDFAPAPGQFVNLLPEYESGDSKDDMINKVEQSIMGENKELVSLGGYGGYVVFGFDHLVVNKPNKNDFKIWGNAFYAHSNPNPDGSREGGSCEPGIVMVSYDANGNGIPDDIWYELAGSEYHKQETIKGYEITYFRPDEDKPATPNHDYPFLNDTTYIRWESNQKDYGYISRNTFHDQPYYPKWVTQNTLTFEGTKLVDNGVDESEDGSYYVLYSYPWGYADNHPNSDERSGFDIGWAIDEEGKSVHLDGINFVKVYTGVNQYCGWLGEVSTEIMGAEDLHFKDDVGVDIEDDNNKSVEVYPNPFETSINIVSLKTQYVEISNIWGSKVLETTLSAGNNVIRLDNLSRGIYLLKIGTQIKKIIKK